MGRCSRPLTKIGARTTTTGMHSAVQCSTVQYSAQHSAAQAQRSAVQCRAVHCSTAQRSAVQCARQERLPAESAAVCRCSTFLDIIISGLVGLRAAFGNMLTIDPLVDSTISYFALDNVAYHNHNISVAFDAASKRYAGKGGCKGVLCVWVDGQLKVNAAKMGRVNVTLSA
jgi:hypothetical protein